MTKERKYDLKERLLDYAVLIIALSEYRLKHCLKEKIVPIMAPDLIKPATKKKVQVFAEPHQLLSILLKF